MPGGVPLRWLAWAVGALVGDPRAQPALAPVRAACSARSAALLGGSSRGWLGAVVAALARGSLAPAGRAGAWGARLAAAAA